MLADERGEKQQQTPWHHAADAAKHLGGVFIWCFVLYFVLCTLCFVLCIPQVNSCYFDNQNEAQSTKHKAQSTKHKAQSSPLSIPE